MQTQDFGMADWPPTCNLAPMILQVHHQSPQKRVIDRLLAELAVGQVLIVPTDTVYAFICRSDKPKAINRLYDIRNIDARKPLSLLCRDIAMISTYARSIPNPVFRFMRSHLPGPYTFILDANRLVDKRGTGKRREVGVRIVNHPVLQSIMEQLDIPLVSTSVTIADEYTTDPEDLHRLYEHQVAAVVDCGPRYHEYSTILDCTTTPIKVIREGIGILRETELEHLLDFGGA
ncbi:MAG: threonylcarbamoyl-AMP synthase [Leptospiraceae bacterium]|nr:threonylcarbamoyl-AMP synthase [Leptospiraceae bacterium]